MADKLAHIVVENNTYDIQDEELTSRINGLTLSLTLTEDYKIKVTLTDSIGQKTYESNTIDLPSEDSITELAYDSEEKEIIAKHRNDTSSSQWQRISIASIIDGLQQEMSEGDCVDIDNNTINVLYDNATWGIGKNDSNQLKINGKFVKQVDDLDSYTNAPNGEIVEYIGETNNDYTNGYFYKRIAGGSTVEYTTITIPANTTYITYHFPDGTEETGYQFSSEMGENASWYDWTSPVVESSDSGPLVTSNWFVDGSLVKVNDTITVDDKVGVIDALYWVINLPFEYTSLVNNSAEYAALQTTPSDSGPTIKNKKYISANTITEAVAIYKQLCDDADLPYSPWNDYREKIELCGFSCTIDEHQYNVFYGGGSGGYGENAAYKLISLDGKVLFIRETTSLVLDVATELRREYGYFSISSDSYSQSSRIRYYNNFHYNSPTTATSGTTTEEITMTVPILYDENGELLDIEIVEPSWQRWDVQPSQQVNNGQLLIQKNGTDIVYFSANDNTNKIANITVPTKTSDLNNDSGFITKAVNDLSYYYTKDVIDTMIAPNLRFTVVQSLPTQDISSTTIYLVPNSSSESTNTYDEYVYISTVATPHWELIGSTSVDLSNYYTKTEADTEFADISHTHTSSDITDLATVASTGSYSDLSNTPTIPPAQVQSDWAQSDSSEVDYILNKPTIGNAEITVKVVNHVFSDVSKNFRTNDTTDKTISFYNSVIYCYGVIIDGTKEFYQYVRNGIITGPTSLHIDYDGYYGNGPDFINNDITFPRVDGAVYRDNINSKKDIYIYSEQEQDFVLILEQNIYISDYNTIAIIIDKFTGYAYYRPMGQDFIEIKSPNILPTNTVGSLVSPVYVNSGEIAQGGKFHTIDSTGEIAITSGTDLDDVILPGTYGTTGGNSYSTIASSLSNCPVTCGFRMIVQTVGSNDDYLNQILFGKNNSVYIRTGQKNNSVYDTWTSWGQLADSSNFLPLAGGTVSGTLILSRTQDASGTANNQPALIVGGTDTQAHMEIDANEIIAKANGTTCTKLWLQDGNGAIGFNATDYSVANPDKFRAAIGAGTSDLELGTTATTAAKGNHTHSLTLATDTGTSTITLAHAGKYKLTAGGKTLIFTMPSSGAPSVSRGSSTLGSGGYTLAQYGKVCTLRLSVGISGTYTLPSDIPKPDSTLVSITNGQHIKITQTQIIVTSGYADGECITYICQ